MKKLRRGGHVAATTVLIGALTLACSACATLRAPMPTPECLDAQERYLAAGGLDSAVSLPASTPEGVEKPVLLNPETVDRAMRIEYREHLRHLDPGGAGGETVVRLLVGEEGCVLDQVVERSSGDEAIDRSALNSTRVARFTPARSGEVKIPVWIEMTVSFTAGTPGDAPHHSRSGRGSYPSSAAHS